MSAVKSVAKLSLYLFGFFVLLLVAGAMYLYVNMNTLAKDMAEQVASNAMGVAVSIGDMDIQLDEQKVVVNNITVANPDGYKNPNAIEISNVTVAMESWSQDLLTFAMVGVNGTKVDLEVRPQGTNLGDIKKNIEARSKTVVGAEPTADQVAEVQSNKQPIKVIVRDFTMSGAQITPSVTLLKTDFQPLMAPDIHVSGIGEKENGVLAREAVAQIMNYVLQVYNKSANTAGFLEGLPLDVMNSIGVSTVDVFKKNLKKSYDSEVDKFKQGVEGLKNMFE